MKVAKLRPDAIVPFRPLLESVGFVLCSCGETTRIAVGDCVSIRTGVSVQVPPGHVGIVKQLNNAALKGVEVTGELLDHSSQEELCVTVRNYDRYPLVLGPGCGFAQLIVVPVASPVVFVRE